MLRVNRAANQIDRSNIILPVYFRKKVIAPLAILRELIVNRTIFKLIVEFDESQDVVLSSFRGICPGRFRFSSRTPNRLIAQATVRETFTRAHGLSTWPASALLLERTRLFGVRRHGGEDKSRNSIHPTRLPRTLYGHSLIPYEQIQKYGSPYHQ